MEKEIANTTANSEQKQTVSEKKANKGILLEVLASAMETWSNSFGCVFCLIKGSQKRWPLAGHS